MNDMESLRQELTNISGALNAMINRNAENERTISALSEQIRNRNITNPVDLFKIPDPIKSIPHYDGNRKQLHNWLKTAEDTLTIFENVVTEQQSKIYFQAVLNKIEGKARDIICLAGDVNDISEVRTILCSALGDRQELSTYKSQLWRNSMSNDMTIFKYFQSTKEIIQKIKTLSKQNTLYNTHWEAINAFIDEDALAAFISGLRKPYFGYAQAAKPKDVEEAYAFLCKFTSNEKTSHNMTQNKQTRDFKPNSNPNFVQQATKPKIEPMEVDRSLQSKISNFKKNFNNHEVEVEPETASDPESEKEDCSDQEDEVEVNFRVVNLKETKK